MDPKLLAEIAKAAAAAAQILATIEAGLSLAKQLNGGPVSDDQLAALRQTRTDALDRLRTLNG